MKKLIRSKEAGGTGCALHNRAEYMKELVDKIDVFRVPLYRETQPLVAMTVKDK